MLLPQELVDKIIDQLHDDRDALAACSLVNTDWVYRSRHHLLYAITIRANLNNTDDRFSDPIHYQTPSRIQPFSQDVRHIQLYQYAPHPFSLSGERSIPLSHRLVSHLAFFSNVTTLTIDTCEPFQPVTSTLLHSVFGSITHLVLRNLVLPQKSMMVILLSGFSALELLDLDVSFSTTLGEEVEQLPYAFAAPISASLHSLELSSWPSHVLHPWFSSPHQKLPMLTYLGLFLDDHDPKHIGDLFSKLGPQLEKLKLTMIDIPDPTTYTRALEPWNFASLTNIRCIAVQWLQHGVPMFLSRALPCLPALEVIQLGIKISFRIDMRLTLPPQLVEVLESFGIGQPNNVGPSKATRSGLPKLFILVHIHTFPPDFMPEAMDMIRTGTEDAQQQEVRSVERQVKASLPLCDRCGALDLRVTIGSTPMHFFDL